MNYFQIASDLHIEKVYPNIPVITEYINPKCDSLILAGDIGSIYYEEQFTEFMKSVKNHFSNVIYILGNKEFYQKDGFAPIPFEELLQKYIQLCERLDVHLLYNSTLETDDLIIFGSTWWSHIPDHQNKDFGLPILNTPGCMMDIDDFNFLHIQARKSLNNVIKRNNGEKKILVVSHYCPTRFGTMNTNHKRDDSVTFTPYYFSSSEKYLRREKIDTWIYGHTHVFRNFFFNNNGTRLISNAGPEKPYFRKELVVSI